MILCPDKRQSRLLVEKQARQARRDVTKSSPCLRNYRDVLFPPIVPVQKVQFIGSTKAIGPGASSEFISDIVSACKCPSTSDQVTFIVLWTIRLESDYLCDSLSARSCSFLVICCLLCFELPCLRNEIGYIDPSMDTYHLDSTEDSMQVPRGRFLTESTPRA